MVFAALWMIAPTQAAPDDTGGRLLVSLLVDTSGSIRVQDLVLVRQLAADLMRRLPTDAKVAVYSFDDRPLLLQSWTGDQAAVDRVLAGLAPGGRYTAFYDAVYLAATDLSHLPGSAKAIVVVTDGRDEKSDVKLTDATDAAKAAAIPIYTVGVGREHLSVLRRMATLSSGAYLTGDSESSRILASRFASGNALPSQKKPPSGNVLSSPDKPAVKAIPSPVPVNGPSRATFGSLAWSWAVLGLLALASLGGIVLASRRHRRTVPPRAGHGATALTEAAAFQGDAGLGDATLVRSNGLSAVLLNSTQLIVLGDGSLVIKDGDGSGQAFKVMRTADTLVGRSPLANVRLVDPTVSLEHCRISARRGFFHLQDLDSTNGTLVNGERVREHVLKDGDTVKIGETALEFREMR